MLASLRRIVSTAQKSVAPVQFRAAPLVQRSFASKAETEYEPETGEPIDDSLFVDMYEERVQELLKEFKVSSDNQATFLNTYTFSQGFPTLEWVLPSPPPHHTYEELPLIKEFEE
eukprot:TRINITY_DN3457_c0_g1_i1.p1 TRINITY_DN3457_c0_g1~~TRINITY_DN3457_c0_g1_i1.p1  ORF type:complete len:115 (+),score=31.29 TRINITY_DN3457_c0_g1_i1:174-518(+)